MTLPASKATLERALRPMITVATFSKPEEAQLLRCRLEAAGIPAFIRDEMTIQMQWLYSNALGGVRVEVPEAFLEEASEILTLPPVEEEEAGDAPAVICQRCGSEQVRQHELPRRVAYLSMLFTGFPLPLSQHRWKCDQCGFRWR